MDSVPCGAAGDRGEFAVARYVADRLRRGGEAFEQFYVLIDFVKEVRSIKSGGDRAMRK